ncbi:hypothetical protein CRG98_005410 [Punica granatum]|uniref:Uncharacterized protein n=1 Tax=Punica granatum TaxID=22663 RepID=A0A2I0L0E7_PUNGR|nr:hypothetical protein CRG98_005410 [Punica granatum]
MEIAEAGQSHGLGFTPDKSAYSLTTRRGGGGGVVIVVGIFPRVLQVRGVGLTRLRLGRVPKGADAVYPVVFPVLDLELLHEGPVMVAVASGELLQAVGSEAEDLGASEVGGAG